MQVGIKVISYNEHSEMKDMSSINFKIWWKSIVTSRAKEDVLAAKLYRTTEKMTIQKQVPCQKERKKKFVWCYFFELVSELE